MIKATLSFAHFPVTAACISGLGPTWGRAKSRQTMIKCTKVDSMHSATMHFLLDGVSSFDQYLSAPVEAVEVNVLD